MKRFALAITAAMLSFPALAETVVIGCPLLKQYSEGQVSYLLNQVRPVISEQEVGKIYYKYVTLKNACQANNNAVQVVSVSPTLRSWLAQNGVDIKKMGKL